MKVHEIDFRVYYEDTDAGGIVYHANYLKFAERARTEMLRESGLDQSTLKEEHGLLFVVRHVALSFNKAARLDHMLTVHSSVTKIGGASLHLQQEVNDKHSGDNYAVADVVIVCVDKHFKPLRIPDTIRLAFE